MLRSMSAGSSRDGVAPYGSWRSPLTSEQLVKGALGLSEPRFDGSDLYWIEARPEEAGRQVVVVARGDRIADVTPPERNVRSRVHEYGGGAYLARDSAVWFVEFGSGGVQRLDARGVTALAAADPDARYADFDLSPDGRWLACVEECPREVGESENRVVVLSTIGGERRVVEERYDFVSYPRFSPDGRSLAWTAWNHPRMPWDGSELQLQSFGPDGPAGAPRLVAGGEDESIFQPGFSPTGHLTFVSDRSGWWNLYQLRDGAIRALYPAQAEFGLPQWVFGQSTWAFVSEDRILCSRQCDGRGRLGILDVASGALRDLELPYQAFGDVQVEGGFACFTAAGEVTPDVLCRLSLADGSVKELRSSQARRIDPAWTSRPEAIEYESAEGRRSYAFLYRPQNPEQRAPSRERPPLLVRIHGGPTGATAPSYRSGVQFWTSRGFALVDVNYGGSTGYGRSYRNLLRGQWGVVDVEDCVHAARHLVSEGVADARRLAISGGSAGGFTTLCALTFHDCFGAGASHFGVADLELLARDTHKFESRYLDLLVGSLPERRDLYRARSPLYHADRIDCPVAFFQGLEDAIVPPIQAEAMVAALASRGVPHVYVPFPGEQHGFRRAENIRLAYDGELYFYAQVFGFDVELQPEQVRIERG
jgi:dipeptidyl aminopeptidase/acylaminoacyl peptidase